MRKKNKLYTANKYNLPLFADVDRVNQNIYDGPLGSSTLETPTSNTTWNGWANEPSPYDNEWTAGLGKQGFNVSKPKYIKAGTGPLSDPVETEEPQDYLNKKTPEIPKKSKSGGLAGDIVPIVAEPLGGVITKHISGGLESTAGKVVGTAGTAIGAKVAMANPVAGGAIILGSKALEGGINALWGIKKNANNISRIETDIANTRANSRAMYGAASTEDVLDRWNNIGLVADFNKRHLGKEGVFKHGITRLYNSLHSKANAANYMAGIALGEGARGADNVKDSNIRRAFISAEGGPLHLSGNMGAIEYGLMSDYLTNYKNKSLGDTTKMNNYFNSIPSTMFADGGNIEIKHPGRLTALKERTGKTEAELWAEGNPDVRKMITFARNARKWKHADGGYLDNDDTLFALGGDLQTHGADWTTGLTRVDQGRSHEENPYDGVQVGVDSEGTPNLVEENETIFNDYVYSTRIMADDATKKKFHLPRKKEISFADISKKLEREAAERPNDPISQAALRSKMESLAEEQERQKAEMEEQRAREYFEQLSPEEKQAAVEQIEAQRQAAAQEQAMAEQQAMEEQAQEQGMQMSPEEAAMMQEQMAQGQPEVMEGEPMMAYGGNLYAKGGVLKFLNSLGYKTVAEAEKAGWKPSDFGEYSAWTDITQDSKLPDNFEWTDEFSGRLTSPAAKAALSLGWNPLRQSLRRKWYEGEAGNDVGWSQSYAKDKLTREELLRYADRYKNTIGYAIKNGLITPPEEGKTISTKDIARVMSETPAFKATNDWLYSDIANQAEYLGLARALNPDDDTKFIDRWSKYGTFVEDGEDEGRKKKWKYTLKDGLTDEQKKEFTDLFKRVRSDGKIGVMYNSFTDPETSTTRYLIDKDGKITPFLSDDVDGYTQIDSPYTWGDEDSNTNNTALFYMANEDAKKYLADRNKTPEQIKAEEEKKKGAEGKKAEEEYTLEPILDPNEKLRKVGLLGPAVGLGMMAAGIGKPKMDGIDAALAVGNSGAALANYQPIGNYLKYTPLDVWANQNRMTANARAAERAIQNNAGPLGTQIAGIVANNYADQMGSGQLFRQAQEYDDALRKQVADFNRGTDQFNAEAFNRVSATNAELLNRDRQFRAGLQMQAANAKMAADADWYNSLYGNVAAGFKGLSDLGREAAQHNMIAKMAADTLFGNITDKQHIGQGVVRKVPKATKVTASKGGKLKRKRGGFTI